MYSQHFGFTKAPFKIPPDPEFFFPGGNRGAVLEALIYAVSRGEGIVKVVGEVGSGKTMLCRMLDRDLPENCEVVYLANPRLTPDQILFAIAFELKVPVAESAGRLEVMHGLQEYLIDKHANSRRVVVFVEEAQAMPLETLEEIRMLSNLETTQDKLLQIVLFGQPELNDKLERHDIRQLRERITYRFELPPFNTEEVEDYVNTRIRASGYRGADLFSSGAVKSLSRQSKGLIRRINILADKALLAAFSCNDRRIEPRHIKMAARDSEFTARSWSWPLVAACLALAVGLGVSGFWLWQAARVSGRAPETTETTLSAPRQPETDQGSNTVAMQERPDTPPDDTETDTPQSAAQQTQAVPVLRDAAIQQPSGRPAEDLEVGVNYADFESISAVITDNSNIIEDATTPSPAAAMPAGVLNRDSIKPDLRPYLRLESLREQLADTPP